ncbi:hypothetical protein P22_1435 [Propionispora sp. 2/2-37]|uniref:universal stress protein n=1 Tax=Propionispora sp. 2/2-37 TaxID=1677858 RepID=UPI0006BB6746|nr:universal stress protein [Propionispora sp. 2/2-37]CUH95365.1 hypothetical protein P22_1435 [Propionispora sp. 2/2-37]
MFGRILVPVDGSQEALAAASYARKIAEKFSSSVTLIHVIQHAAYLAPDTHSVPQSLSQSLDDHGKLILEHALEVFHNFDGHITARIVYGHPGIKITEIARESNYSLIIMGRRGISDVAKLLIGSVSNYVLHYAPCPTLIVRNHS